MYKFKNVGAAHGPMDPKLGPEREIGSGAVSGPGPIVL